jgi:hypothetical protein
VDVGWFGWTVPHQEPLKSRHGQRWTFQPRSLEISPASPDLRNQPENINLNLVPKVEVVTSSRVHGTLHMATRPVKPQSRLRIALRATSMSSQVLGNAVLIREVVCRAGLGMRAIPAARHRTDTLKSRNSDAIISHVGFESTPISTSRDCLESFPRPCVARLFGPDCHCNPRRGVASLENSNSIQQKVQ